MSTDDSLLNPAVNPREEQNAPIDTPLFKASKIIPPETDPPTDMWKGVTMKDTVQSPATVPGIDILEPDSAIESSSSLASPSKVNPPINTRLTTPTSRSPSFAPHATADEVPFDFQTFLDQIKTKGAEPVARYLRSFLTNFARRSFSVNDQIKLIHDFLDFIFIRMRDSDVWKNASPQEFDNASEAMEKLVMNRLYDYTFTPEIDRSNRPVNTDDLERDHVLQQRIMLFGWIREQHLDIPVSDGSPGFISFAQQELLKINHYKAPRDKMICVLNCCKVIFGLIRHLHKEEGADAFVPILIFIVLKANPVHLLSNIEYINRFRRPEKLQSEAGYYLSSLMGAVSFIETMDHSSLSNISQEEFERNVEEAILHLPASTTPSPPSSLAARSGSSYVGDESARLLKFPSPSGDTSFAEDTRRFFQRTGETISKPMNLIGKIFTNALDGFEESSQSYNQQDERQRRESPASAEYVYASPIPTPYQPRIRPPPSSSRRSTPDPQMNQGTPPRLASPAFLQATRGSTGLTVSPGTRTPDVGGSGRASPMDFSAMQREIDRAHEVAASAARETLLSIFPGVESEVADLVLEATNGDLGLSIEKLLEMGISS